MKLACNYKNTYSSCTSRPFSSVSTRITSYSLHISFSSSLCISFLFSFLLFHICSNRAFFDKSWRREEQDKLNLKKPRKIQLGEKISESTTQETTIKVIQNPLKTIRFKWIKFDNIVITKRAKSAAVGTNFKTQYIYEINHMHKPLEYNIIIANQMWNSLN